MINCVCTGKVYDNNSRLIGYRLQDTTGKEVEMRTGVLKNAIRTGQIAVSNLELTESNRLKYIKVRCFITRGPLYLEEGETSEQELKRGEEVSLTEDCEYKLKILEEGQVTEIKLNWPLDLLDDYDVAKWYTFYSFGCKFIRYKMRVRKDVYVEFSIVDPHYAHEAPNIRRRGNFYIWDLKVINNQ